MQFRSTPPRGRRRAAVDRLAQAGLFRSTPPRGRRPTRPRRSMTRQVSIHASAREATADAAGSFAAYQFRSTPPRGRRQGLQQGMRRRSASFDPRLREGGDAAGQSDADRTLQFRSTPPRGRRQQVQRMLQAEKRFRSTPPRGRRLPAGSDRKALRLVSIHASAREATGVLGIWSIPRRRFDPRLREGGDA